jgi:hypothetical protein
MKDKTPPSFIPHSVSLLSQLTYQSFRTRNLLTSQLAIYRLITIGHPLHTEMLNDALTTRGSIDLCYPIQSGNTLIHGFT